MRSAAVPMCVRGNAGPASSALAADVDAVARQQPDLQLGGRGRAEHDRRIEHHREQVILDAAPDVSRRRAAFKDRLFDQPALFIERDFDEHRLPVIFQRERALHGRLHV